MLKKIKKLVIIFLLFALSGCGLKYNNKSDTIMYDLFIGKTFKENIVITMPKSAMNIDVEDKDNYYLYKLFYEDLYPIDGNSHYMYNRKINSVKDRAEVILSYDYLESEFDYANYATRCFQNYDMITADEYFEAHLSGEFYCWNGMNVRINVDTNYNVVDSNGDQIINNYVWNINKDNYQNVDIYYKVARDYDNQLTKRSNNFFENFKYIIGIIVILGAVILLYRFYKKKKKAFEI